ncbi:MAG: hypothetical protein HDT33_08690 [Clostridiales bacterium]|nr:hypothetical protein [Clostridiales bacterium]
MNCEEISFILPDDLNSLGVLGYLVILNELVHSDQIKCLDQYLSVCNTCMEDTCLAAIIDGKDDAMPFSQALEAFSGERLAVQECLYYLSAELAHVDGCLDGAEKVFLHQVQCSSKIAPERCTVLFDQAHQDALSVHSDSNVIFTRPYKEPVTLKSLLRQFIGWLCMVFRKLFHLPAREQTADEDYTSAIKKCAEIAKDDFCIIQPAYEWLISQCDDTVRELTELKGSLDQETDISADVAEVISSFSDCLSENVLNQSQQAHAELLQKERTLSDFTISLLGRTKAGKSTLHSVLTGQGRDRIGAGMQRTTRYNRVYQWNLLRLIDTPGIGSAEDQGRADDQIAARVLGESDIICLVVVDDSILQDVLEFMKKLAALNKPIIILLNHKENIEAEVKFQKFINHPTDWLTSTGEDNLQGHINRIRRYACEEGFDALLSVYPVFLLPALMAQEEKYARYSKLLWDSSNIDSFIDQLKIWITVSGPLKRSQTLIDGAIQNFSAAEQAIAQGLTTVQDKVDDLKRRKPAVISHIREQQTLLLNHVKQYLTERYGLLESRNALDFAEEYWEYSGDLSPKWAEYLERVGFGEDIKAEIDQKISHFTSEIDDTVREVFEDLYFSFKMSMSETGLRNSMSFDFRSFTRILGGLLDVAGSIVLIFLQSNWVGWLLLGIGAVVSFISGLFKSNEKKRKEAIDKIYKAISSNIRQEAPKHIDKTTSQIRAETDHIITKIEALFDQLTQGLECAVEIGNGLTASYAQQIQFLNMVFAWRILTFLMGTVQSYQQDKVEQLVSGVERTDSQIRILTSAEVSYPADALKNVITEEIDIAKMEG